MHIFKYMINIFYKIITKIKIWLQIYIFRTFENNGENKNKNPK